MGDSPLGRGEQTDFLTVAAVKRLGLIGHPVGHSQSPKLFAERFERLGRHDLSYEAFDLSDVADFPAWAKANPDVVGLNVTVPHKSSVMPFLQSLGTEAEQIGAVNTLVRTPEGWVGHNTDAWGFRRSIQPFLKNTHERALVLGTGGSAAAVICALRDLGIDAVAVSRSAHSAEGRLHAGAPVLSYDELNPALIQHHLLVVHCTPVGMSPSTEDMVAFPTSNLGTGHLVVDLVYSPPQTQLLREAQARGAVVLNGQDMLRLQADKAWEIWAEAGV